jgi:hypothetical protein
VLSAKWIRGVVGLAALVWALIAFLSGETLKWSWAKSLGLTAAIVVWAVLAYDRWIWKWPGIRRFAGKPVIHGTWKTELRTSYRAREDETIEAYLVIRQTYSRICVEMLLDRSESISMSGDLVRENGRCVLYYVFRSEKHTLQPKTNPTNRGAAQLTVATKPAVHLEGDYWMEVGSGGRIATVGHSPVTYETFGAAQGGEYT